MKNLKHHKPGAGNISKRATITLLCIVSAGSFLLNGCENEENLSDAYGNFEATEVMVSAETGGRLVEFSVEEGTQIDSGFLAGWVDTLALNIKKRQLQAQKAALESRLQSAEAQTDVYREQKQVAEVELDRVKRMFDDGSATRQQLDEVEGRIRIIGRQIAAAESQEGSVRSEASVIDAQIEAVQDQIARSAVRNPVAGTVLARYAEPGEMVSPGMPLFKVADLETMYLRAYISGSQLSQVKLGQQVEVLIDGPDGTMESISGEISWIASRGEFTPRTIQTREERVNTVYAIKVRVPNDGRLKIGMPGEVNF